MHGACEIMCAKIKGVSALKICKFICRIKELVVQLSTLYVNLVSNCQGLCVTA